MEGRSTKSAGGTIRYLFAPVVILALVGLLGWPRAGQPAQTNEQAFKLYLKNGNYQLVKSYEVNGDRVRYYSTERSDWEEVPVALVDFEATKRGQDEEKAAQQEAINKARALDNERFERAAPTGYEVAPGIHLPSGDGAFAYDGQRVIPLIQSSAEIVKDKKRFALALAIPAPLLKNRDLVVLEGPKAAVRIRDRQPVFYVQFADIDASKIQLIPVDSKKEMRVIEKISSGIGVGASGESRDAIPTEHEEIKPGLLKIRPAQPLATGEYALGELISQKLNLDVWDFGIDGAAAIEPDGGDKPPVIRHSDKPPQE